MTLRRRAFNGSAALAAAMVATVLAACGGGSSSGSGGDTPTPEATLGSLSLAVSGGVPTAYQHVWVTVDTIAFNADADRAWSPSDTTWKTIRLDTPKTIDLAASINGVLTPIVTGQILAAGDYAQMRLLLVRHDDTLAASAKTLDLAYNAQVDYLDATGSLRQVPLELFDTALGLRAAGPFSISSTTSTDLTLQVDVDRNLVRFTSDDGIDRFTLRPEVRAYDIARTGAIIGIMDKSMFCSAIVSSGCVHDVVASVQRPSADGRAMIDVRTSPVVVGDTHAAFALYPLPVLGSGETFDVVIRGRNMRTMLVRAVPASADALLAANPTQLGVDFSVAGQPVAAPLVPSLSARGDSVATLASPTLPTSAQLRFAQTLPGAGEMPRELVNVNTDPFTGVLARPAVLSGEAWRVATYAASGVLIFSDVTPVEGVDAFTLTTVGTRYDFDASLVVSAPGGATSMMSPAPTSRRAAMMPVPVNVNVVASAANYDAAQLVIADVGGIVATQDVTVSASGTTATVQLPAGTYASALGGTGVYSVSVRAWKRSAPASSLRWARASSVLDLRGGSAPSPFTVTLP